LNAVFQKSKGYAKGAAGLSAWKKSAKDNQKSLENKSTTVHTTVETEK
jgi:hypothetical protein